MHDCNCFIVLDDELLTEVLVTLDPKCHLIVKLTCKPFSEFLRNMHAPMIRTQREIKRKTRATTALTRSMHCTETDTELCIKVVFEKRKQTISRSTFMQLVDTKLMTRFAHESGGPALLLYSEHPLGH